MSETPFGRREFIQSSAVGAAMLMASGAAWGDDGSTLALPSEGATESVTSETEVLVVGGGTAGTIAALQAARAGAKTMIVERGTQLGGTMTTGGVAYPGLFAAWGEQVIAGIGWELVKECVEMDEGTFPDFSSIPKRHWKNQVKVNEYLYPLLAEEKCAEVDVQIAYYEFPVSVKQTAGGWEVQCRGFGTERRVLCKQIIDCTGGAQVVGLLNLPRLRDSETQPGSYVYSLGKQFEAGRIGHLDYVYIHGADSSNSRSVTEANLTGRRELLKKVRETGKRVFHTQAETSFRESYRIVGETLITVDDYTSGRVFEDAVCYAFYPVDLHTRGGVKPKKLKKGVVPTIPLRALIPKSSRNIIVAGRCVSSDRLANSGLRVQASCMAMGQAAGAAAAIAVKEQTTPLSVPLKAIRQLLQQNNAIIPAA
jgi:hypothetical protein